MRLDVYCLCCRCPHRHAVVMVEKTRETNKHTEKKNEEMREGKERRRAKEKARKRERERQKKKIKAILQHQTTLTYAVRIKQ